jgi:hypothetical protein
MIYIVSAMDRWGPASTSGDVHAAWSAYGWIFSCFHVGNSDPADRSLLRTKSSASRDSDASAAGSRPTVNRPRSAYTFSGCTVATRDLITSCQWASPHTSRGDLLRAFRQAQLDASFFLIFCPRCCRFHKPTMFNISMPSAIKRFSHISIFEVTLVLFLGICFLFAGLFWLLRPVDRRPSPSGKKWRLPPGPRGYPLIGNLLLYGQGEAAVC